MGRTRVIVAIALALATTGCAVGNFLTGAPASRSTSITNALLERRCSSCHAVPDPASMSIAAWQASLERMKVLMTLPPNEWDSLAAIRDGEADR